MQHRPDEKGGLVENVQYHGAIQTNASKNAPRQAKTNIL